METALTILVWQRANNRCEYCQIRHDYDEVTFEIDHIISRKHGGLTQASNLALSCFHCNVYKGSDIAGRTPGRRKLTPLFNPRRMKWSKHFQWNGPILVGRTDIGRVTIALLNVNDLFRIELRRGLIEEGHFP